MPLGANKSAIMGVAGVSAGDVVLLSSQTASNSASIAFTSDITSTYGEYIFKFYAINPATDVTSFSFQANAVGASGYNETITSTFFRNYHAEDDSEAGFAYLPANDQAQGTAYQDLTEYQGNGADECSVGELHIFNPSSTTYLKQFFGVSSNYHRSNFHANYYYAGYLNVTAAIDEIQFKMSSGNFDGTIKMWGVK